MIAELIKADDPTYHHTSPFHTDIPVIHPAGVKPKPPGASTPQEDFSKIGAALQKYAHYMAKQNPQTAGPAGPQLAAGAGGKGVVMRVPIRRAATQPQGLSQIDASDAKKKKKSPKSKTGSVADQTRENGKEIAKKAKTDNKDVQKDSKKTIKESKEKQDKLDKEAKKVDDELTKKIKSFEQELDEASKKHGSNNPDKVKRSTTGNTAAKKGLADAEQKV